MTIQVQHQPRVWTYSPIEVYRMHVSKAGKVTHKRYIRLDFIPF